MDLKALQGNWELLAKTDPLYAVVSWPDKKGNRWNESEFFKNGADEVKTVMKYLGTLGHRVRKGRVLDFGCGVGRLTQAFARNFDRVDGVDIAPKMIELAKHYNRHPRNCYYHLNTSDDLHLFAPDTFDFIYTNITLQHMRPRYIVTYLHEFLRIIRPGGIILFQVPALYQPVTLFGKMKKVTRQLTPDLLMVSLNAFKRIVLQKPVVEMNILSRERVVRSIEKGGAKVLDVQEDPNAGPEWLGYRYCVMKPA